MWKNKSEMDEILDELKQGVKIVAKVFDIMAQDDELIDSLVNLTMKFRQKLIDKGIDPDTAGAMAVGMSGSLKK